MRTLKDKKPRLPTPKVLPAFREIAFFVTFTGDGFVGFLDDIRSQECDNLIVVLNGKFDEPLDVLL